MQSNLFKQTALPSHYLVIRGFSSGEDVINVWQNTLPSESCDYYRRGMTINVLCRHFDFHLADRSKGLNYPLACKSMNWMVFTLYPRPLAPLFLQCNGLIDSQSPLVRRWHTLLFLSTSVSPLSAIVGPFANLKYFFPKSIVGTHIRSSAFLCNLSFLRLET